jgi:hypothetical protein
MKVEVGRNFPFNFIRFAYYNLDILIILNNNKSNEPESNRYYRNCYSEYSRGISVSSLQIISSLLSIAEAAKKDYLLVSVQTT